MKFIKILKNKFYCKSFYFRNQKMKKNNWEIIDQTFTREKTTFICKICEKQLENKTLNVPI